MLNVIKIIRTAYNQVRHFKKAQKKLLNKKFYLDILSGILKSLAAIYEQLLTINAFNSYMGNFESMLDNCTVGFGCYGHIMNSMERVSPLRSL